MSSPEAAGRRLGLLGGGQLARMLAEAALALGAKVYVLAANAEEPAAIPGVELVSGNLEDPEALGLLLSSIDVLGIENEFLDLPKVKAALAAQPTVPMLPSPSSVAVAQDKLAQKRLFDELGIPTARYVVVEEGASEATLRRLLEAFPEGFVLKWSRFGYDGKGNFVVRPSSTLWQHALAFCEQGRERGGEIYAEELIDFQSEVAMVSTRSPKEQVYFPLVVSVQEEGVCREVFGPASAFGVEDSLAQSAQLVHQQIGRALEMHGTFAVEFFSTRDGRLLANEMAPRVHNTGHFTLWPGDTSQFETHVRALLGLPLAEPKVSAPFVMRNLLGPFELEGAMDAIRPSAPTPQDSQLYWYDKAMVKPGRKMGHVTGRAPNVAALTSLRAELKAFEDAHWNHQRGQLTKNASTDGMRGQDNGAS